MALNRFSVLPTQQIVNTYVSPNLQYANAALAGKQKGYDEGLLFDTSTEGTFGKYAVRNVDIARRDKLHDDYVAKAQAIVADKYQGDYGQALPELRKLAASTGNDEFWNRATTALSRQKDMYDTEKAIQKKGGTSLAFNRDAATKAIYNDKDGSYSDVDFDVQERLDWTKPKIELMKDIAKDSSLSELSHSQIDGVLQYGSAKGVDAGKVIRVAKGMLAPYMDTAEGKQEMRDYLRQGATPEEAQAHMLRSLAGIGQKQVGSEMDQGYHNDPIYLHNLKKAEAAAQDQLEMPGGETGATVNSLAPAELKVDGKGRTYTERKVQVATTVGKGEFASTKEETLRDYKGGESTLAAVRTNFEKLYPEQKGISDKKLTEITQAAIKNSQLVTFQHTLVTPKRSDAVSKMTLGANYKKGDISGLQGKQIMVATPNGGSKQVTMQELQAMVGEDREIKSAQVTGSVVHNTTIPGAYRVTLHVAGENGKKSQNMELIVGGPKQEQDFKAPFQPLVNSAYSGKNGRTEPIDGQYFTSTAAPRPDGKGFNVQVRGYEKLPNGNVVPMRERVLDRDGNPVLGKDGLPIIKRTPNGRPVYVPQKSLEQFNKEADILFQKRYKNLFNGSDYTNKEAEEEPELL